MLTAILQLSLGLLMLVLFGDLLVRGAVKIALLARISASVVGLTVVAMGTSLPELAVSVGASGRHAGDIAYGNIVGSCIFNIAVILGLVVLMQSIRVGRQTFRWEYPFMFLVMAVGVAAARDQVIDRVEGALFLVAMVVFVAFMIRMARREVEDEEARDLEEEVKRTASKVQAWTWNVALVAAGGVGLAGGADLLVRGGVTVATYAGISQRIIGLTIAAMGTSLPELAASIAAARRGQAGLALSNVIGSNIFNILGILGVTALIFRVPVNPLAVGLDNWAMLAFGAAMFPMMARGMKLGRLNGTVLLAGFAVYMWLVFSG